jgi:dihydropteroate synthase
MKSATENKIFYVNQTLNVRGRLINLATPKVMGILNVTPDSFYDGGRYDSEAAILHQAEKMIAEGAAFIDVGGYSTRPGADDISVEEETRRVVNAIKVIVKRFPTIIISIDTFRSEVARAAMEEGASIINDISGGEQDPAMLDIASKYQLPFILMHMRGNPKTMTQLSTYENLIKDVADYFHAKIAQLHSRGIKDIILDPGFGFAKTAHQNFQLLNSLDYFKILNKPLLIGISRKSMIWRTLSTTPDHALNGTTSLNTIALLKGASILRVHDVKEAVEAISMVSATMASY